MEVKLCTEIKIDVIAHHTATIVKEYSNSVTICQGSMIVPK